MDGKTEPQAGQDGQLPASTEPRGSGTSAGPYQFEELFGDAVVVRIQLRDKVYELRRTKSGKLVLNR